MSETAHYTICGLCDERYDPNGPRAQMHEHPEPQSGPDRDRFLESGLEYGEWATTTAVGKVWAARKSGVRATDPAKAMQNLADSLVADILALDDVEVLAESLVDAWRQSLRAERERCAVACDELAREWEYADRHLWDEMRESRDDGAKNCAAAIRALPGDASS